MRRKSYISVVICLIAAVLMTSAAMWVSAAEIKSDTSTAQTGAVNPVITSITPVKGGLKISWEKIEGVSIYRLDRYYTDGRGWVTVKKTSARSYIDTSVKSGNTYTYRLMGLNSAGNIITPSVSKTYNYIAPPEITSAEVTNEGIKVKWSRPGGVDRIALYRKTSDGGWKAIRSSSSATSFVDKTALSGEYTYTVGALNDDGSYLNGYFDEVGVTVKILPVPKLSVTSGDGGVELSWNAVDGAQSYRAFVYKNGKWTALGDTKGLSFLDDTAVSGQSYTYTVRCVSDDGRIYMSYYDTVGKTVDYVAAPKLKAADCTNDGIRISWEKSEGAYAYRVFYKNSSGGWTRMGDTSSTSFTDTDVRIGSTYTYTVRCISANGDYISYFDRNGIKGSYLSAPVLTSVTSGENGVDIKWNAVDGAVKYRVYYYGSRGWTRLADTTETYITDTDVSSGYTYTYTVRCISEDGSSFTSDFLSGKSVHYIAAPVISGFTNTENGVKISWGAVRGAELYRVYYLGSRGWTRMTDTTSTSYLDEDVSSGSVYTYTVRCLNSSGTAFTSDFKPGVKQTFIAAPDFSLSQEVDAITVSWPAVKGANKYRVYRYGDDGWAKLTDTSNTSVKDKTLMSGSTGRYTVRCLSDDGSKTVSDFKAGKSMKYIAAPKIYSVTNTTTGVKLKWNSVEGAAKYRVYHKNSSGGWTRITDTSANEYTDIAAVSGNTYEYTVRCVNQAGNAFESGFYPDGAKIRYIASPKSLKAECENNSIRISWAESRGAEKYRVYYYGSKGWTKLTETADTSVIDDDVASGYTYRYTVRCITENGNSFTSDFDREGVLCPYNKIPVLNACDVTKDGVVISWNKPSDTAKYRVYRYSSKGWSKIGETVETSYTDKNVSSGNTYRYTVRCISNDGKRFTSDCDTKGVSAYFVAAPKLTNSSSTSHSLTFTWSKPDGSTKYRVYKKSDNSWSRLTETYSNSYTDTSVTRGNTYSYTVRCVSADGEFQSGFDPYGFIITASGGDFVYYDQTQYDYPYGDDTIAGSGCGPTAFAMVASTITGKSITPVDAVAWCGNKYYMPNVGTYWSYFEAACKQFGVGYEGQTDSIDTAIEALKKGKYVISSHGPGLFTRGGHFIVMSGIDYDGKIIVYDPNGYNNYKGTSFTRAQINASGTSYWIFDEK